MQHTALIWYFGDSPGAAAVRREVQVTKLIPAGHCRAKHEYVARFARAGQQLTTLLLLYTLIQLVFSRRKQHLSDFEMKSI